MREIIARNLFFPESARWHDGAFWFSDIGALKVHRLALGSAIETVAEVENQPSGLGWLPDGRLLVVSMKDQRLLRLEGGKLVQHADLSGVALHWCNDMVVDRIGRAYVGCLGSHIEPDHPPTPAPLVRVDPDGRVSLAAADLMFPNGVVVSKNGSQLIVAETAAHRLAQFDVDANGALSNRRKWAEIDRAWPDGICIDSEDAVWAADPFHKRVTRIRKDGVLDRSIDLGGAAPMSCALGGADGRTLMVCVAPSLEFDAIDKNPVAWLEVFRVDVPGLND